MPPKLVPISIPARASMKRAEPSKAAIDTVMTAFLSRCEGGGAAAVAPVPSDAGEKSLSALLSEAACEEAAAGR